MQGKWLCVNMCESKHIFQQRMHTTNPATLQKTGFNEVTSFIPHLPALPSSRVMLSKMKEILDNTRHSLIFIYDSQPRYTLTACFLTRDALTVVWHILTDQQTLSQSAYI